MPKLALSRIELTQVSQSFFLDDSELTLFDGVNLCIEQGQSYAITGPSGAGKSSLLVIMSGLERPRSGSAHCIRNGQLLSLGDIREDIGFIFQQFHLLPELTALHNVSLPLKLRGHKNAEANATKWLERVGLAHRLHHTPSQLSGGEQQRAAIARALVFEPDFIFADEPTGNLDAKSADSVADTLFSCCQEYGAGLVMVTHSDELAARAQKRFTLKNGVGVLSNQSSQQVASC